MLQAVLVCLYVLANIARIVTVAKVTIRTSTSESFCPSDSIVRKQSKADTHGLPDIDAEAGLLKMRTQTTLNKQNEFLS